MNNRNCPICNSIDYSFLYLQEFNNDTISLMKKYEIVYCNNCGMIYANKIPEQEIFEKYYKKLSKYEFKNYSGIVKNSYIKHFQKIKDFILQNIEYKKKNIKILDIGCSTGSLLNEFKKEGFNNLLGIEPAKSCKKIAKNLYNIKVISDGFLGYDSNKRDIDVIILSAVLEHLIDIKSVIKKIVTFLKLNGYIYIEIPDARRFYKYIQTFYQQFSGEHINYFGEQSIINFLNKYGFEIVKIEKNENRITQIVDPDLFILAKWTNHINSEIKKDKVTVKKVKKYIKKCRKVEDKLNQHLLNKLKNIEKIIVWGVGLHTQLLLKNIEFIKKIDYFVDSNLNYRNKKLIDKEIRLPEEIKENIPILISSYGHRESIEKQIKNELKLKNEIINIYG
jgi:2-polyprenyl-3-methyl-5-hydroxy-6-metoxy-1,4-benzoquinol methylase